MRIINNPKDQGKKLMKIRKRKKSIADINSFIHKFFKDPNLSPNISKNSLPNFKQKDKRRIE